MTISNPQSSFIASIKEKVRIPQYEAPKNVTTHLRKLYGEMDRDIFRKQDERW